MVFAERDKGKAGGQVWTASWPAVFCLLWIKVGLNTIVKRSTLKIFHIKCGQVSVCVARWNKRKGLGPEPFCGSNAWPSDTEGFFDMSELAEGYGGGAPSPAHPSRAEPPLLSSSAKEIILLISPRVPHTENASPGPGPCWQGQWARLCLSLFLRLFPPTPLAALEMWNTL